MASIRNRSPWRVSIKGAPDRDVTFPSKKQAETHRSCVEAQGIVGARVTQERNGAWEVRVRRAGANPLIKTFDTKRGADEWAAAREGEIAKREAIDYRAADKLTLADALQRFVDKKTTTKTPEAYRLLSFKKLPFAAKALSALKPSDFKTWRDDELKRGRARATVVKGLHLVSQVIKTARQDWNIALASNPASAEAVSRPKLGEDDERDRTLAAVHLMPSAEEVGRRVAYVSGKERLACYERRLGLLHRQGVRLVFHTDVTSLMVAPASEECALLRAARYPHWYRPVRSDRRPKPLVTPGLKARIRGPVSRIWAIVSFGIETAMRRGEMAQLRWEHVHLDGGYLALPGSITKNRRSRIVPLSLRALRILRTQPRSGPLVFNKSVESIEAAHHMVIARCGSYDLRFHDLRHEATTRLVQNTNLPQLAVGKITGHRDIRMLARYYNPTPEEIVKAFRASRR